MNKLIGGYLTLLLYFLGIGFISGSIVHFTLNPWRFGLIGVVGGILFAISTYIKDFASHQDTNTQWKHIASRVVTGVLLSIGLGMISGSIQHFDEITMQALWYIPIGTCISLIAWYIQESDGSRIARRLGLVVTMTVVSGLVAFAVQQLMFPNGGAGGHHGSETGGHHGADMGMDMMQHAMITSEEQFIAEMIPHHQEAVDTAMIIVAKGQNPELKIIAQAIIDGQSQEIAMMKGWMADRYPSSSYQVMYQNMMRPLEGLDGHDLEDQFMKDMIMHHQGAIQMAQQVLEISQKPEIVAFANDIINAQSSEINKFQALLDDGTRH